MIAIRFICPTLYAVYECSVTELCGVTVCIDVGLWPSHMLTRCVHTPTKPPGHLNPIRQERMSNTDTVHRPPDASPFSGLLISYSINRIQRGHRPGLTVSCVSNRKWHNETHVAMYSKAKGEGREGKMGKESYRDKWFRNRKTIQSFHYIQSGVKA